MVVDKPKKKSAKKTGPKAPKAAPKAPVGRPRKKLGTRVSDLPLVSTLRPRASRSNQDSMALQRARLQFKRDYPQEKGIDEFQSRALLDAMADTSRGPIGTRVLGPAQFELDKLAKKLLKAKEKNKPLVLTDDGKVFVTKKAAKKLVSSILAGPTVPSAAPAVQALIVPPIQAPDVPGMFEFTGKEPSKRTRSQTKRLAQESISQIRRQNVRQQEEIDAARKKRKREEGQREPRQADQDKETAQERELRSIKSQLDADMAPADRMRLVQRMKAIRQQQTDGEQVDMTPYDEPDTPLTLTPAQETQVLRIVNKFATEMQTKSDARIMAEAGIKAIKAAPPVVQHAAAKALSKLPEVVPSAETVKFQNALDDLAQIAAEDRRRYAAVEALPEDKSKSRRTFEQDFEERERIGQSSREEGAKFLQMTKDARDRQEAATRVAATIAAPTPFVALQRKQREKTTAKKIASAKDYTSKLKALRAQADDIQDLAYLAEQGDTSVPLTRDERIERRHEKAMREQERQANPPPPPPPPPGTRLSAKQKRIQDGLNVPEVDEPIRPTADSLREQATRLKSAMVNEAVRDEYNARLKKLRANRDQDIEFQNLAELAEQGDQSVSVPSRDRRARRIIRENYLDDEFEAEDVDEEDYDELVRRNKAATTIQDYIQSALSRSKLEKQKEASSVLQDAIRRSLARNVISDARRYRQAEADADFDRLVQEDLEPGPVLISPLRLSNQDAFNRALARSGDIFVPGSTTRQNNRQAPPTKVYGPGAEERVARKVMNYVIDRAGTEMAVTAANKYIDPATLQSQIERLRKVVPVKDLTQASVIDVKENPARVQEEAMLDDFYGNLNAKLASIRKAKGPYVPDEDWDELDPVKIGDGLVGRGRRTFTGGVLSRLRGMGFFDRDGLDNILYPMPKAMDNKKLLADAKAAYAATGGTFDGRTDFRVLMDAMKTLQRPNGGAMGGSVVLSGVPTPSSMTGGYPIGVGADSDEYKLHYVSFPDDKWTTSSSLRWLRSNGIVPIKKAMHIPEYYKYQILPPSDNKDYIGHELVSRGRKILLGYARPSK